MDQQAVKQKVEIFTDQSSNSASKNRATKSYFITKRCADLILATIGLLSSSFFFIFISIAYLFGQNKGPIFFKQLRVGKNGKLFYIYKFRSMVVNAEQILKEDVLLYQQYLKNNYKLEPHEDPRITKLGKFLRKTSLDELPQLLNVLKGDMSLVGPRPVIKEELIEYNDRLDDFLSIKPGLTGYWQICGRSEVGYPERAKLEFYYLDKLGFKMDFDIIIKTIKLVLNRKGAY